MPRKSTGEAYHWDEAKERAFLQKLDLYVAAHAGHHPPLTTLDDWAREFNSAFGGVPAYGLTLQQKRDRMRKIYRGWKSLQCRTGLGYDPLTDRVICSDEAWHSFLRVINNRPYNLSHTYPFFAAYQICSACNLSSLLDLQVNKECNHLRYEGLRHKELYYNIFEKTHAAGASGYGSVSMPDATPASVDLDGSEDYSGIGPVPGDDVPPASTRRRPGNRRPGPPAGPSRSRCSSGKRKSREEADDMTFKAMQEVLEHYRDRSESGTSNARSSRTDHMLECMSAMTDMGIPPKQRAKMWDYFSTRPGLQRTFHKLPEVDKGEIVAMVVQSPPPPTD